MKTTSRLGEVSAVAVVAFVSAGSLTAQTAPNALEGRLYGAAIAAADASLRLHDTKAAKRWLDEAPAGLRSFEWSYLRARADESRAVAEVGSAVNDVAANADGSLIASTSSDGSVKLWEGSLLKAVRTLVGHTAAAWGVAFSPDGKTLASGSSDGTVRLWSVPEGAELRKLQGVGRGITAVAFSPDGSALATTSWDRNSERGVWGVVKIWDPKDGRLVHSMEHGVKPIVAVAFSPDGGTLAAGTWDDDTTLWNTANWAVKGRLQPAEKEPYKAVQGIAFSPGGSKLAVTAKDGAIRVWDAVKGSVLETLVGQAEGQTQWINDAVFLDETQLATVSQDGTLRFWDTNSGKETGIRHGHTSGVTAVTKGPRGLVVTGSLDGTLRAFDPSVSQTVSTGESMYGLAFSPDGSRLALTGWKGLIKTFDSVSSRETAGHVGHGQSGVRIDWSRDGKHLASTGNDGKTVLWDAATGEKRIDLLVIPKGRVEPVVFHPNSTLVAGAAPLGVAKIWRVADGSETASLSEGEASVTDLAWSPDGATLGVATSDGQIRLWDWRTRSVRKRLVQGKGSVMLAFDHAGRTLATASSDRTIVLWNVLSGERLHALTGHDETIHNLAFSPDGRRLASASSDKTVRIWDPEKGSQLLIVPFGNGAFNLAWSPDGQRLAVLVLDRTMRWIDARTGR